MKSIHTNKGPLAAGWRSLVDFIKQLPNKKAIGLALVSFAILLMFGLAMFQPVRQPHLSVATVPTTAEKTEAVALQRSEPVRLRIGKIGVDAPFISLGLKTDGTMQTPNNGVDVGWYKYAPTPGESGPAVVAAHVDTKAGPAVFARLDELAPGDTFAIDRADGTTATFVVTEVKQYPQSNFPTEEVYGNIDHAGIRLITCAGTFSRDAGRYSHNTIVFGSLLAD